MKKICLITPGLLPVPATQGGAIETLITSLIKENECKKDIDLTVITTFDKSSLLLCKDFQFTKFIQIPNPSFPVKCYFRIKNALGRRLLKSPRYIPNWFYHKAFYLIRNLDFDTIIFEGGPAQGIRTYELFFPNKVWYHLHYCLSSNLPFSGFTRVLAVSNYAGYSWRENCCTKQQISTVYNGINTNQFIKSIDADERNSIRTSLGFKDDDFVVMYCGRIIKEKGILELLRAIKLIDDKHVKLMIIGSSDFGPSQRTPYVDMVMTMVNQLGNRVVYTGYVSNENLYRYSKSADIQIIPSIWEEAAGLVGIEGMAAGLPLIVTRSGGIQEYVSNDCSITVERDGKLVESLASAIMTLYNDPVLRDRMVRAGVKRARQFSAAAMYDRFVAICEQNATPFTGHR